MGDAVAAARPLARPTASARGHWFSTNPDKAWGERFFLAYSPYWIVGMGVLMQSGVGSRWGDVALNAAMLVLWVPALLVPAILHGSGAAGRPWHRTYWFKFNLWIAIFSGVGSYFGSEYFFDVLGMIYRYPQLQWNLDATLLGSGQQRVPLIMYWSAHFYFLTYHTASVVLMRRVRTSALGRLPLAWPVTVVAAAYCFAWAETYAMAGGAIAENFGYRDLARMLRWGSLYYALYFVVSFPMVYRLDEAAADDWSLGRTAIDALAAGMLVLFLLDGATKFVGTLY